MSGHGRDVGHVLRAMSLTSLRPMLRVAAVQLEPVIGDVEANLDASQRLVRRAAREGAQWVLLPEFFTTGMGFLPALATTALPRDGAASAMLHDLARELDITVGGSFLCADADGEVRNAFVLVDATGVLGRHDKDIPTLWENCFYLGGADDGIIAAGELTVGAVLCAEFNRWPTVHRLRSRVDLVVGGSFTWGIPDLVTDPTIHTAYARWVDWAPRFARLVGAPVVEAGVTGSLDCALPGFPDDMRYRGPLGRSAVITDATGVILAERHRDWGEGIVVADVHPRGVDPVQGHDEHDAFWIHDLDPLTAAAWDTQNPWGRHWYTTEGARLRGNS